MKTLFVDTSFFLQVRNARELPWSEVAGNQDILLMVPRTVQEEIDKLKQDGNSRRSKRARKAATLFRTIVECPDFALTLREGPPRVRIQFPPPLDPNRSKRTSLDLSRADDRIVEEALAYAHLHQVDSVFLFTNDTGPMLTAREHGLAFIPVPDLWMLDPEPDERDKFLQGLQRRVEVLEKAYPIVELIAVDSAGDRISELKLDLPLFTPLSEASLADLMQEIGERCPAEEANVPSALVKTIGAVGLATGDRYEPPTDEAIRQYYEITYPAWLENVRTFLGELHVHLNEKSRRFELILSVANTGRVPALNAMLEFEACAGILLNRPKGDLNNDVQLQLGIPSPPRIPQGTWKKRYGSSIFDPAILRSSEVFRPELPDRNAFYWKAQSGLHKKHLSLTCDEFRHQEKPERFGVILILPERGGKSSKIDCKFSASNLPEPSLLTVPVRIEYHSVDPLAEALRLITELPGDRARGDFIVEIQNPRD